MSRVPRPRDDADRPEGHHVGNRWHQNPPGTWWPDRDQADPDRPTDLPAGVDGEQLGRRR